MLSTIINPALKTTNKNTTIASYPLRLDEAYVTDILLDFKYLTVAKYNTHSLTNTDDL
jgi:hypothetical protein